MEALERGTQDIDESEGFESGSTSGAVLPGRRLTLKGLFAWHP